jgi:pimeloyl-ACP methyl ester carboxylesterase
MKFIIAAMLLLLSLAVFGFALWQVSDYSAGLQRIEMSVPAVRSGLAPIPILLYRPVGQSKGIAIVAHGYSADKELMQEFTIEFARLGLSAYSLDFPGHGEAQDALSSRPDQLEDSLQAVYNFAQQQAARDNSPTRTVLLGHSMGSRAVTLFALDRADNLSAVAAVIPVSVAMSEADLARLSPIAPYNLLMLVGSADLPGSIRGTAIGIANASKGLTHPEADPNAYGDWTKGSARKAVTIPGANHLTILFSPEAQEEAATWAARSLNLPLPPAPGNGRNTWTLVMLLAAVFAAFPFTVLFSSFADRKPVTPRFMPSATLVYLIMLTIGSACAVLTLTLFNPLEWLGLTLTPYLTTYFFIAGGLAWLVLRPLVPTSVPRLLAEGLVGGLAAAVIMWLFWYFVLGSGATFALFRLSFSGANLDRLGKMLIVALLLFPYFSADEAIWRGWQQNDRPAVSLLGGIFSKVQIFAALLIAIAFNSNLDFLGLALPVLAILFVIAQSFSFALYAATRNAWACGWWNALFFAWVLVMLFPAI